MARKTSGSNTPTKPPLDLDDITLDLDDPKSVSRFASILYDLKIHRDEPIAMAHAISLIDINDSRIRFYAADVCLFINGAPFREHFYEQLDENLLDVNSRDDANFVKGLISGNILTTDSEKFRSIVSKAVMPESIESMTDDERESWIRQMNDADVFDLRKDLLFAGLKVCAIRGTISRSVLLNLQAGGTLSDYDELDKFFSSLDHADPQIRKFLTQVAEVLHDRPAGYIADRGLVRTAEIARAGFAIE